MARTFLLAIAALTLAACSPPATTSGNGASAPTPSAAGNGNNITPGQYRTTVTILSLSVPGLTPAQTQSMQQPITEEECVTNSDLSDLTRQSLIETGEGETCTENHMTAARGRIEGAATCTNADGDARTMQVSGSFTATHVDMDATMTGHTARGPESQHVHMTANRIGECPARSSPAR